MQKSSVDVIEKRGVSGVPIPSRTFPVQSFNGQLHLDMVVSHFSAAQHTRWYLKGPHDAGLTYHVSERVPLHSYAFMRCVSACSGPGSPMAL